MTSTLRLVRREPDKAYVCDMLWLPKRKLAESSIKESLQFWTAEKGVAVLQRLWDETNHHLICPREFLAPETYKNYGFDFVDLSTRRFTRTHLGSKIRIRDEQAAAYAALARARGGVLNLAPGKGKTVLSLQKIVDTQVPALIVVHNTFLWEQWQEKIHEFIYMPIGKKIGRVQGQEFDWKHPITIAMIHTLANRADNGTIPMDFRKHFGMVVFDEVHHLSAPLFAKSAPLVQGMRFGLTATANRLDGMEFIYKYHIGDVFYSDLEQDLQPRIYFQKTPVYFSLDIEEVLDISGQVSIPKMRTFIGDHDISNQFRYNCINDALKEGRKIICLSHSKKQLQNLSDMFPGSGLVIQETPQEKRGEIVRKSRICFAIAQLGGEGLDDDMLDTLFVLTPFSSPNDLQQFMGRIQRAKPGKKTPVVVVFDDVSLKPFHGLCHKLKKTLKEWDMPFEVLNARK